MPITWRNNYRTTIKITIQNYIMVKLHAPNAWQGIQPFPTPTFGIQNHFSNIGAVDQTFDITTKRHGAVPCRLQKNIDTNCVCLGANLKLHTQKLVETLQKHYRSSFTRSQKMQIITLSLATVAWKIAKCTSCSSDLCFWAVDRGCLAPLFRREKEQWCYRRVEL